MAFSMSFMTIITVTAVAMLIWACVEVGSNDAANLVNAVFGARVLKRRKAVNIAGFFVILGAAFSSPVLDTVRKGIFDLNQLTEVSAVSVFISAYLVNTLLLNTYSSFGLPVSSTIVLVFSLLGGALGVANDFSIINGQTFLRIVGAIFCSIVISGIVSFFVQRFFRYFIRKDSSDHEKVLKHGPWIFAAMFVSLSWFLLFEGLKDTSLVQAFHKNLEQAPIWWLALPGFWLLVSAICSIVLRIVGRSATQNLFKVTAILGMVSLAFSFGQNDLGNCASPGLAILLIWQNGLQGASHLAVPFWALLSCGFLMYLGMRTTRAQRVTRAEINTASQQAEIKLYAPKWCRHLATSILKLQNPGKQKQDFTPESVKHTSGKKMHYDPLRASVILAVNASVISFASGLGLPISATYVGFISVVATGWGDGVFTSGSSDLKLGRAIWVIFAWFLSAFSAAICAYIFAFIIFHGGTTALVLAILFNIGAQIWMKRHSDRHELEIHGAPRKIKKRKE